MRKIITKEEHEELFYTVDNEGFGYYMTMYGPDIDLICKLGFSKEEVVQCIKTLSNIQSAISNYDS